MTLTTTAPTISYVGDGVTSVFAVPFVFYGTDELEVWTIDDSTVTQLVKDVDYTVSGGNGTTGNIAANPASGVVLTIRRATTQQQSVNFTDPDPFDAETTERGLDRLVAMIQEQGEALDRTIRVAPGDGTLDLLWPADTRAGFVLGFSTESGHEGELALYETAGAEAAEITLAVPGGGVFSVSSPITGGGTLTISSGGTIGGVPYFNASGSIATTGALTRYAPVIGGGTVSAPHSIAVGTSGQALVSAGGTADPAFGAINLAGGAGVVTGALPLANIASIGTSTLLGNSGTASAAASAITMSAALDFITSASTRGTILYRGASGWAALAPSSTIGAVLASNGTGADPSYLIPYETITVRMETSGTALATGYKATIRWPRNGVIAEWAVVAEASGAPQSDTCSIDITSDATFGTNTSMVGAGTKPNLSAASSGSASPASWTTTSFTAGHYGRVNLTVAPATATAVTLFIKWRPTA